MDADIDQKLTDIFAEMARSYDEANIWKQRKRVLALIQQEIAKARIDELERLKSLHTRIHKQTVADNRGNVYANESNSYISIYETDERIAELCQTLKESKEE